MRMSGPALYRYFASREDLLVALVADSHEDLADTLEAAAAGASAGSPSSGDRLRAVTAAYRAWALAHPHRYRLVFASRYGSGLLAPDRVMPAATRTMDVLSAAVAELGTAPGTAAPHTAPRGPLAEQLNRWQESRAGTTVLSPATLHLSVLTWTRLHGLVSLEIEGVFVSMGMDAGLLLDGEVEQVVIAAGR